MPKCEAVTKVLVDDKGMHYGEKECGKPAMIYDSIHMCFCCARRAAREGDMLSPSAARRFRDIERIVCALPS